MHSASEIDRERLTSLIVDFDVVRDPSFLQALPKKFCHALKVRIKTFANAVIDAVRIAAFSTTT